MKAELKSLKSCSQGGSELGGGPVDGEDSQVLLKGGILLQQIKEG